MNVAMVEVTAVEALEGFVLRIAFSDGVVSELDVEPYLRGPIFEPLKHAAELFRAVRVEPNGGGIEWPNGADMDPLVLHGDYEPAWMTEEREARQG